MTTTPTPTLTRQAVHTALVELLTTGQHHHAATPATLHAVGDTRRTLTAQHDTHDPAARYAPHDRRLAALSSALGEIGTALFLATCRAPDPVRLYRALTELAAIALGWLDTLPNPTPDHDDPDDEDGPVDEPPF